MKPGGRRACPACDWLRVKGSDLGRLVQSQLSYQLDEPGVVDREGVEPSFPATPFRF